MGSNVTATWRAHRKGAYFGNPCYTQIHPTCIPVSGDHQSKLTLMSESLRNDGRIWVPKRREDCDKDPRTIAEEDRDYYLERIYPSLRQPRAARHRLAPGQERLRRGPRCRPDGRRLPPRGLPRLRRRDQARLGKAAVEAKYGNLFDMYARITGENPYETPMRIYPAVHYTMGGLWVDYDLQSSIPGLFVTGEANFSDHGANRLGCLGAHAGPGRRLLRPAQHHPRLPRQGPLRASCRRTPPPSSRHAPRSRSAPAPAPIKGERSVDSFHKELGHIMWEYCGMERTEEGLLKAIDLIRGLREEFWRNVRVLGSADTLNQSLEKAGRVADFLELGELMCIDALHRRESCGGHFRAESQTEDGEALRHDDQFLYVAAWEFAGRRRHDRR
jgi:succinate dehydrogenase / fumarate reductase flavoprotein subunit